MYNGTRNEEHTMLAKLFSDEKNQLNTKQTKEEEEFKKVAVHALSSAARV